MNLDSGFSVHVLKPEYTSPDVQAKIRSEDSFCYNVVQRGLRSWTKFRLNSFCLALFHCSLRVAFVDFVNGSEWSTGTALIQAAVLFSFTKIAVNKFTKTSFKLDCKINWLHLFCLTSDATHCTTHYISPSFHFLTFDTPEMISVLLFVGVFLATLVADSVSCRMAVSATGSRPLDRRLLSEQQKHKYLN